MSRKRIGELLVEQGAITQAQLQQGLDAQKITRQRLGATLVEAGVISEDQLVGVLSQALQIERIDLGSVSVEWAAIHMLRARFCETNDLVPIGIESRNGPRKSLVVALSDPLNTPALQEIEFTTGLQVSARIAPLSQVRAAIIRYYHRVSPSGPRPAPSAAARPVEDEPAIVVGQELPHELPEAAVAAMQQRAALQKAGRTSGISAVSKDLAFLVGGAADDEVEKLEQKFWALMRILARKGLVTPDEFAKELQDGEQ